MRLLFLSCLSFVLQASGLAFSPLTHLPDTRKNEPISTGRPSVVEHSPLKAAAALAIEVDSIHQINCLRAAGYLAVKATGGIQPYEYDWSNGFKGTVQANLPAGPYSITVTDGYENTAVISVTITEDTELPEASVEDDFTAPCSNSILTIDGDGSTGANYKYQWAVSNGGVIQSGANTLHPVIKHTGTFTLIVTNSSNGCTNSAAVHVSASHEPPVVTATGGAFSCEDPILTLGATYPVPNTKFIWNGPNGYSSTQLHPQVSAIGTYIFKVTDTLTTCFNTANAVVTADTVKPVGNPIGGMINCNQPSLTIGGTYTPADLNFFWSGPGGYTSTLPNPVVTAGGTYKVTITDPDNGCSALRSAQVTADITPPTAFASASGTITCQTNFVQLIGGGNPTGITFAWTGPAGFTSSIQNPSVSNPGTYSLTTTNPANGCKATANAIVMSNTTPPGVTATGGQRTCANPDVVLHATSGTSNVAYFWSGPSNFSSTQQNPTVSVAGTYTVRVTNPVNGCTSTSTTSVTQNFVVPSLTTTSAIVSCNVPNPKVNATSTTPGATFAWVGPNNFSANIPNPEVTVSGPYTVTATSPANGCTTSKVVYVDENLAVANIYAGEDRSLNCNFASILANPIGTSVGANYTYQWTTWDGNIVSGANILYARFDQPGHYTLKVKNLQSGCSVYDSLEIFQTPTLTLAATQVTPVACNGGNNGSIKAVPSGGSGVYTSYIWSNGGNTATLNNLSAAAYSVTVTDNEGCTATATGAVTQPGVLVANITTVPQTQVGVNNGSATVNPTGGTAPFTYKWSNNGTTATISNLAPGTYTVTLTDSKGCTVSNTANVNGTNCALTGETTVTNLTCAGTATGTATANVNGSPGPYTYAWSSGATTKTASDLAAGNYTVTVSASNGCSTVLTSQITGPQPLLLSVIANTGILCEGMQNGSATMSASGGTSPYTYAWSNGNTSATAANLGVGPYTATVTDSKGCTVTQTTQITAPQAITLTVTSKNDVACNDGSNGSITLNATGGTAPFNYSWSNSASGPTVTGLSVGNYLCTVTDANGCTKTNSTQIVATDNVAPQLILKNASVSLGANGIATVTPAMFDNGSFDQSCSIVNWTITPTSFNCTQTGTSTVTLTATDKNGNVATSTAIATIVDDIAPTLTCPANQTAQACSSTVTFTAPQIQDNCSTNGTPLLISGLPSGSSFPPGETQQQYSYTDAGGNTATCSFTVTVSGGNANIHATVQASSCSGSCDGSATLTLVTGGTPNGTIQWSNGQSGAAATNLCAGNYVATLTDGSGCSQTFPASILVQDNQPPVLTCPANIVVGYCNTAVTFDQPQVNDNCVFVPQQLQLLAGLPSGSSFPIGLTTQFYRYTDGGGNVGECSFDVTVHLAASVNSSTTNALCGGACNGTAEITVSGGQGPFNILWNNGSVGANVANLCAGVYSATVTDADGCDQVQSVMIGQPSVIAIGNSNVIHDSGNTGVGMITVSITGGTMPYTYSWTRNGQPFATSQNITNLFSGEYVLLVIDARGCSFTSLPFTVSSSVATSEPGEQFAWLLYPNPAQAEVFITSDALQSGNTRVSIFDASGRLVLDQEIESVYDSKVRIDLNGLPDGMLLVRLTNEFGNFSKMLVKAKQ